MCGGSELPIAPAPNHCGKRSWSTMITRMFGRWAAGRWAVRSLLEAGFGDWSPLASASALMPRPAPASAPPAIAPRFSNVRRSSLISCFGSMSSMRVFVLGPLLALGLGVTGLTASAAAQSAPTCVPTSIDNSALQADAVTVSPLPGSRDASPRTQVSFLGVTVRNLTVQSVVGSRTGPHDGRLAAYSQGDGASFVPARPFDEGERVAVRARARAGGSWHEITDEFAVARSDTLSSTPETIHPGGAAEEQRFRTRPDLHPPSVTVTASSRAAAPGDIFVAPYTGPGQAGPMILDPAGSLLWFKPLPRHTSATNLRVQEYGGRPVLTWWQGDITVHGFGVGEDVIYSSAYELLARVRGGNGHRPDLHDFFLGANGTAFVTSYFPVLCDLSAYGGSSDAALTDGVLQEIDVRTGLVMYEWTSLDHVPVSDPYASDR